MDVYEAKIKRRRLHIDMKGSHPFKYEFELLHSVLGEAYKCMTTYIRIDNIDFLVVYNEPRFLRTWDHVIHPKPAGSDWTSEEIEKITHLRRLIFPLSERTQIDWMNGGHLRFNEYSLIEFYRLPMAKASEREANSLVFKVCVANKGDRLVICKPESLEQYLALDAKHEEELSKQTSPQ